MSGCPSQLNLAPDQKILKIDLFLTQKSKNFFQFEFINRGQLRNFENIGTLLPNFNVDPNDPTIESYFKAGNSNQQEA